MTDQEAEAFEEKIYEQQEAFIKENFGDKAAEQANYGWAVDGDEEAIEVATKVYGHGVLKSTGYWNTGKIEHNMD